MSRSRNVSYSLGDLHSVSARMAEPPCSYGDRIVIRGCPVKLMSFRPCEKAVTCQTKNKKIKLRTFIKYDEPHPATRQKAGSPQSTTVIFIPMDPLLDTEGGTDDGDAGLRSSFTISPDKRVSRFNSA